MKHLFSGGFDLLRHFLVATLDTLIQQFGLGRLENANAVTDEKAGLQTVESRTCISV